MLLFGALLISSLTVAAQRTYYGFDANGYPGDDLLPALHQSFAYTGYWLNNPPGMTSDPWAGKRQVVRADSLHLGEIHVVARRIEQVRIVAFAQESGAAAFAGNREAGIASSAGDGECG